MIEPITFIDVINSIVYQPILYTDNKDSDILKSEYVLENFHYITVKRGYDEKNISNIGFINKFIRRRM